MNFEPVHIHNTRRSSHENLIFLLIPILLFVVALLFFTLKKDGGKVSGVSTEAEILTNTSQK